MASGKVAFITGSTSGIGLGIAERFAQTGHDVIFTGIADKHVIDEILVRFKSTYKGRFMFVEGDLTDEAAISKMCDAILTEYPAGVDILVNNAGFQHVAPLVEYPIPVWHRMVAVQLTAPFLLTRTFLPYMKKKGWGRIINTSSQMGLISEIGKVPYSAVKSGVIGLTKGTALEAAEYGVTCNAICPGFVETDLVRKQLVKLAEDKSITYQEMRDKFFSEKHPSKKPITVEQVAGLVSYLCSEEAASISGSTHSIDTGYTAR